MKLNIFSSFLKAFQLQKFQTWECTFNKNNALFWWILDQQNKVMCALWVVLCLLHSETVPSMKRLSGYCKTHTLQTFWQCHIHKQKNIRDELFQKLSFYHKNIKLTLSCKSHQNLWIPQLLEKTIPFQPVFNKSTTTNTMLLLINLVNQENRNWFQ